MDRGVWLAAVHRVTKESDMTEVTVALQAALSTGFPRQQYWSG